MKTWLTILCLALLTSCSTPQKPVAIVETNSVQSAIMAPRQTMTSSAMAVAMSVGKTNHPAGQGRTNLTISVPSRYSNGALYATLDYLYWFFYAPMPSNSITVATTENLNMGFRVLETNVMVHLPFVENATDGIYKKVYYGSVSRAYTSVIDLGFIQTAIGTTNSVDVEVICSPLIYFAMTTYDQTGAESDYSNEAVFTNNFMLTTR